jgi:hypothetical protein
MTAHRDPDRLIRAFLMEGQTELADPVYDAVRATIEHERQRVVIGPWRMPNAMNKFVSLGLGAAAVAVVLVVGLQFLPSASGGVGAAPSATPTPSPTPARTPQSTAAAPSASAATAPTPPPLRASFTSTQHGISVSYPEGWTARPATEPWTDRPGVPQFLHPGFDVMKNPVNDGGELFLWITSRPIGDSTPEDWVATMMAAWECTSTEPIAVDGATGLIGATGCHELAAVTSAGRGYEIGLYHGNTGERLADPTYTRAWFEEVLATVQLHPGDAVDAAPSATP